MGPHAPDHEGQDQPELLAAATVLSSARNIPPASRANPSRANPPASRARVATGSSASPVPGSGTLHQAKFRARRKAEAAATVRVDAHCHLWQLARGDYGWLDAGGVALDPIRRDFTAADLAPLVEEAGIAAVVAVQAAPTEAETAYLLDLADAHSGIGAVVGWTDLAATDAADRLDELAQRPKLRGVRPMLQDIADANWIMTTARPDALDRMETLGLSFDALVLPVHLEPIARLAEARPGLAVVIDHAAKPALGAPPDDPRHAMWRTGMARLGRDTAASVKLSGLLTEMRPDQRATTAAAVETLRPVVDRLLEWFGPERMIWGSDWPVLTLAAPFAAWFEITDALLSGVVASDRDAILGGNAARFYRLGADAE